MRARPEEVDLDGRVEGRVERDGGRRVDHDVARGEDLPVVGRQAETVTTDIPADRHDALVGELPEAVTPVLLAEPVEGVVLQQLTLDTLGSGRPLAVADEQHEAAVGDAAEQALDECRADEAGGPGDGDAFSSKRLGDHELQV